MRMSFEEAHQQQESLIHEHNSDVLTHTQGVTEETELDFYKHQYELIKEEYLYKEKQFVAHIDRYYEIVYELKKYDPNYVFKYWDDESYQAWINKENKITDETI